MQDTNPTTIRDSVTPVKKWLHLSARVFLVAALAVASTAQAVSIVSGEDLQKICDDDARFSECTSYLETIYKTAKAVGRLTEPKVTGLVGSCGPELGIDTVPLSIARRLAWQAYAARHPERLQGLAVDEVLLSFEERWPCRK